MAEPLLRSRYVMAGGVRTHYVEAGTNGPAVVLCHGGAPGLSGEMGFGKIMPALGGKFQAYAPDSVGGFGDTDTGAPATDGAQSRVDHLSAFADVLCLDGLCLAGNSQGAWVVVKYASEHPDRVHKLFLIASGTIATAMGLDHSGTEGLRALQAYDGTRPSMRRLLETLVWDKSQLTDALVSRCHSTATRPGAEEARRRFRQGMERLARDPNLRPKFDMAEVLPRLKIPALFVWGEEDRFAPVELGRQLERLLPNISFKYIARAGHLVQNDQPELVSELMREFFSAW
ncbi:MAG: alpha/beta hydrolase [Deltaproteobacteria bacterium]|nr:alpha/beta hydrolase [Deltaproteobacteria bacterium]